MPKIPDDQKPAIGKVIAPAVFFWFRWAALATIVNRFNSSLFKWLCSSSYDFRYWKWWW